MNQSNLSWLFGIAACVIVTACSSKSDKSSAGTVTNDLSVASIGHRQAWIHSVAKDQESLHGLYTKDAIHVNESGLALNGVDSIVDFYSNRHLSAQRYITKAILIASKDSTIYYELAEIQADTSLLDYLVIGKKVDKDSLRVFEFAAAAHKGAEYPAAIDEQRQRWMEYCNAHQVSRLVDELYSAEPIYYNHKPLVRGKELLKQEYGYMEREQYHLTLTPIFIEPVSETMVYEIGQCSGSYGGKYILIWQREQDGKWRILLDSNI